MGDAILVALDYNGEELLLTAARKQQKETKHV
jgi:hypothetical protein